MICNTRLWGKTGEVMSLSLQTTVGGVTVHQCNKQKTVLNREMDALAV
jgi:hypothetical protein